MITLLLKGTHSVCESQKKHLTIDYYLVQSLYENQPVYGIQIQSQANDYPNSVHAEGIWHISYSLSYVSHLLDLCMDHLVTPTDLFSSLDILMDKS